MFALNFWLQNLRVVLQVKKNRKMGKSIKKRNEARKIEEKVSAVIIFHFACVVLLVSGGYVCI